MGTVTDSFSREVRDHLTEKIFQSHDNTEKERRLDLGIQSLNYRWVLSSDLDCAARNGLSLGERRVMSHEWVCHEDLEVRVYDPGRPELGHGVGYAGQTAPLEPYANGSLEPELEEIDALIELAFRRAIQDFDRQRHLRLREPSRKPRRLIVTPNVNHEDLRGKRSKGTWDARYYGLEKILRGLTARVRALDPKAKHISGGFALGHVYNNHVRQVVIEISPDRIGAGAITKKDLIKKMIHRWDQFGIVSLYARYNGEGVMDQVVRHHAPLIFPSDINLRGLLNRDFHRFIRLVDLFKDAPAMDPGEHVALLHPPASSTHFHETFLAHGINGPHIVENMLAAIKGIGQKLSDYEFDAYVNGAQPKREGGYGTSKHDDLGIPSRRVQVVRRGRLVNFLETPESAAAHDREAYGNARVEYSSARDALEEFRQPNSSQTFALVPEVRASYAHFEASDGGLSKEELELEARRTARRPGHLSSYAEVLDIHGGDYIGNRGDFLGLNPFVILHNVRTGEKKPVRGVDIRVKVLGALKHLLVLGNKHQVVYGFCGSDSGEVPISDSVPMALVDKIEFYRHVPSSRPLVAFPDRPEVDGDTGFFRSKRHVRY